MKSATFADQGMMNHKKPELAFLLGQLSSRLSLPYTDQRVKFQSNVLSCLPPAMIYYSNSCINSEKHNCWTKIVNTMY